MDDPNRGEFSGPSDDVGALVRLASDLLAQGDCERATVAAQKALQVGGDIVEARVILGQSRQALGYPMEASFQYKQVLARHPDHVQAKEGYESVRRIVMAVEAVRRANPPELQLDVRRHVVVLTLVGMMAPYTEDQDLREAYERLTTVMVRLMQLGAMGCVVDLTRIGFVTSFFLSVLLDWRRKVAREDRPLAVCASRPEIRELLISSRINRLIPLLETLDEAIVYVRNTYENPPPAEPTAPPAD